jgi:hypothetical protein
MVKSFDQNRQTPPWCTGHTCAPYEREAVWPGPRKASEVGNDVERKSNSKEGLPI